MRHIALAAVVVAAAARPAAAEEPDPDFVAMPKRSVALSFVGHATRVGGAGEGGSGTALELALGSGRWQVFAEGMLAGTDRDLPGVDQMAVHGRMLHGGAGLRWLARQFIPAQGGGFELYLSAATGVGAYYWDDGGREIRPDLAIGAGMQARVYEVHDLTIRLDLRVLFAQGTSGLLAGIGLAW